MSAIIVDEKGRRRVCMAFALSELAEALALCRKLAELGVPYQLRYEMSQEETERDER
jgi:hypothetical protein